MSSYSITSADTFTLTHAKHMAAKVATDLKRMQRFYGRPTNTEIADYEAECIALLKAGYLGEMTYGFRRNGDWIPPTLRYTARDLAGASAADDDPGRVPTDADISGATFYSYHVHGSGWHAATQSERDAFPHKRVDAPTPGVNGYMVDDRTYSAGGKALGRSSVRNK